MLWILGGVAVFLALIGGFLDTFLSLQELKIAVLEHISEAERIADTLDPVSKIDLKCSINSLKKAI